MKVSPAINQFLVVISAQLAAFSVGGCVVYPQVLLYQLKGNDTAFDMSEETASWNGSIHGIAGIPSIFMSTLMQWKGRKFGFLTACVLIIVGWIVVFFANNPTTILISECLHGIGSVSVLTTSLAVMGLFTLYVNWRPAAILMCIPVIISAIIVCVWPESPSWLAYKGEFNKCKKTFFSVRGTDDRSLSELRELITAQMEIKHKENFSLRDVTNKVFYVPIFHMFLLLCLTYWSGSIVISIYSIQIIKEATTSETYANYGSIFIHFSKFLSILINGAILTRYFKNRTVLLSGILSCIIFLSISCVINVLQNFEVLGKDSKLCFYSYLCFIICISCGIIPMAYDMSVEIIPVRYRGVGGSLYIIFTSGLHTSSLKLAPYLIKSVNVWGILLIYTLNAIVCGTILWRYLPETKGKTLQEIEDYYTFGKFTGNRIVDTTQPIAKSEGY